MSTYRPKHDPPRAWERLLASPFAIIAIWGVCVAVQLVGDAVVTDFHPSPALGDLPWWITIAFAAGLGLGNLAALVGLFNSWENRTKAWGLERSGWIISSAAWTSYAFAVLHAFPGSTVAWGSSLTLAAVGVVRMTALYIMTRRTQRKTRQLHDEARAALNTGGLGTVGRDAGE